MLLVLLYLSVFSFCAGKSRNEISFSQDDAETTLGLASIARENIILRLSSEQPSNTTCSCVQGLRTLRIDLFDVIDEIEGGCSHGSTLEECLCNQVKHAIEDQGGTDLKKFAAARPKNVIKNIKNGKLKVTKKLSIGLLHNSQYQSPTPDLITLISTVSEEIKSSDIKVKNFEIKSNDGIEEILLGIVYENKLEPNVIYQVLHLVSAINNVKKTTPAHPLLLMRSDEYPKDVIDARNALLEAIDSGCLTASAPIGWESQTDGLLALLTQLLQTPNSDPLAVSIHVVYSHYRLHYLGCHGYTFHPEDISDIAFLLNSFLTIRSPALIQATFSEFARLDVPWHELLAAMDYSQYSSPRTMFLDMLRTILDHPESLKLCNTILLEYFINADAKTTPDWLVDVFKNQIGEPEPIDLSKEVSRIIVDLGNSKGSKCPGEESVIIDPEALIEIIGQNYEYDNILDMIRYNPVLARDFPQKTRVSALRAILAHIRNKKYRDEVSNFIISRAIKKMPINDKGDWPVEVITVCPNDLEFMTYNSPSTVVNDLDTHVEREMNCTKVHIINPDKLLDSTPQRHSKTIKELVYMKPILFKDYNLATRKEILMKVLKERQKIVNDDPKQLVIPQDYSKLTVTWVGSLPPEIDEMCENDLEDLKLLSVNDTMANNNISEIKEYQQPLCTDVLTINPTSLLEILPNDENSKLIKKLILSKPILASEYKEHNSRSAVLKAFLANIGDDPAHYEPIYWAHVLAGRVPLQSIATDPVTYIKLCSQPPKPNTPSLESFFVGLLDGLGESTIPCDINNETTTQIPATLICPDNEVPTIIVKTESLWNALSDTAPAAPHIRARVSSYIVPIEQNSTHTKSDILEQILENIKSELEGTRALSVIDQMMKCIRVEGPGLELPENTTVCLSQDVVQENLPVTATPYCSTDEILTKIVKIDSLFDAFLPTAPKTTFIREKMTKHIIPLDKEGYTYTKAAILEELLQNLKENITDPRVARNVNILLQSIRKDGSGLEQPDSFEICLPRETEGSSEQPATAITQELFPATIATSSESSVTQRTTTEEIEEEPCEPDTTSLPTTTSSSLASTELSTTLSTDIPTTVLPTASNLPMAESTTEEETSCEPDSTTTEQPTTLSPPITTTESPTTSPNVASTESPAILSTEITTAELLTTSSLPTAELTTEDETSCEPDSTTTEQPTTPSPSVTTTVDSTAVTFDESTTEKAATVSAITTEEPKTKEPTTYHIIETSTSSATVPELVSTDASTVTTFTTTTELTTAKADETPSLETEPLISSSAAASASSSSDKQDTDNEGVEEIKHTTAEPPPPCHSPDQILDPESLLNPIHEDAQKKGKDMVKIIENSTFLKKNYADDEIACEIVRGILNKMKTQTAGKLSLSEKEGVPTDIIKNWIHQLENLLGNISCNGEAGMPPRLLTKCVDKRKRQ